MTLNNPIKNKNQIIDTKREVIALKKKLNEMTKDASKEQQKAMKKLAKESYKSAISNIKEEKKNADNKEDKDEKEVTESAITFESDEIDDLRSKKNRTYSYYKKLLKDCDDMKIEIKLAKNDPKARKKFMDKLYKLECKANKAYEEHNKANAELIKKEKEVTESVDLIIEKTDDDKKVLSPELKRIDFKRGKLADLERELEKAQSKFIDTGDVAYEKKVTGLTYKIEKLKKEIAEDEAKVKKATQESVVLTEAANMEDEIKPIVNKLNEKGYKVKYASPGHRNLRKKEDKEPDGVYYDKLYSDARIMFKDLYKFPDAPKYWHWREVDGCSYLDISPLSYNKKDGTPDEAFAKWKENYMNSLKKFVDDLGSKEDEVKESINEFVESMMDDIFLKMGFDELEMVNESVEDYTDSYDKVLEEMDNLLS